MQVKPQAGLQVSSWAPALMCSTNTWMIHSTVGCNLAGRFSPSTYLGRSAGILASTATLTPGFTMNVIACML